MNNELFENTISSMISEIAITEVTFHENQNSIFEKVTNTVISEILTDISQTTFKQEFD